MSYFVQVLHLNHFRIILVAGEDYTDLTDPVIVTFSVPLSPGPPTDSECISIDILDDNVLEGNHDFEISIVGVSDDAPINDISAITTVVIHDNEGNYSAK